MDSPNTPNTPETPSQELKIEPLKLKAVNGFRARIGILLKKIGKIVAPAVLVAHFGGDYVQDKFRESVNYDPDKVAAQSKPAEGAQGAPKEFSETKSEESDEGAEETKSRWQRAKEALKKAKEWSKKKYENFKDRSKLINKYRETKKEMRDAYYALVNAVDKGAYWGPFLLLFLATIILSNKILRMKKNLTETVDPQVEKNMQDIEAKVNELVEAVNDKKYPSQEEVVRLMERFEKYTEGLGTEELNEESDS